jgi:hypothetical protein
MPSKNNENYQDGTQLRTTFSGSFTTCAALALSSLPLNGVRKDAGPALPVHTHHVVCSCPLWVISGHSERFA